MRAIPEICGKIGFKIGQTWYQFFNSFSEGCNPLNLSVGSASNCLFLKKYHKGLKEKI